MNALAITFIAARWKPSSGVTLSRIPKFKTLFCGLKGRRIIAQGKGICAVAPGYGIKTYSRHERARPYGTVVCDRFLPCDFGIRVYV